MNKFFILLIAILAFFAFGCDLINKSQFASNNNLNVEAAPGEPGNFKQSEPTPTPAAVTRERNLFAFAEGAIIVEPYSFDGLFVTAPILIIDGSDVHNWVSAKDVKSQVFVLEMPDRATIKTLVFDNDTSGMGGIDAGVKDLTVEISDTSLSAGFREILSASLKKGENGQKFNVAAPVAGRWIRATFKNNHGGDRLSLTEIRGYGESAAPVLSDNISGTYQVLGGEYHIKQDGTSIIGCYQPNSSYSNPATFTGGLDGNIGKIVYTETVPDTGKTEQSSFLMIFQRDGKRFFTGIVNSGGGLSDYMEVKRSSNEIGECKDFNTGKKTAKDQIGDELKKDGRAAVYGINFDFNSDAIRPESKNVLEQITTLLKENVGWKMTVEGHTDNVGGEAFNQTLSEKRAKAVKDYLVASGIGAERLQAVGKGLSQPVAGNENEFGRAQNRRVELVKQ